MTSEAFSSLKNNDGFVLVSTLWIVGLLSLLALSVTKNSQIEIKVTHNYVKAVKAQHLADGGVQRKIFNLLKAQSRRSLVSTNTSFTYHGAEVETRTRDEAGKIDLNRAPTALLEKLFISSGVPAERSLSLVETIFDWRDKDSNKRPNGAELRAYSAGAPHSSIKNAPFEYVEELLHVRGIDQALYKKIAPSLTTLSGKRGVDPSNASSTVIGLLINNNGGSISHLFNGWKTNNPRDALSKLRQMGVSKRLLTSPSRSAFSIQTTVMLRSGTAFTRSALVKISGTKYAVHSWQSGQ